MSTMPQLVPISDIRYKPSKVLASLENGPVLLSHHSNPVGVLVSVEEWDQRELKLQAMKNKIAELEGYIEAIKARERTKANPYKMTTLTELCQRTNRDPMTGKKLDVQEKPPTT